MLKKSLVYAIALFVFGGATWLGCNSFPSPLAPSPLATGRLALQVTDKPFPVDFIAEALVTITRVEVRPASEDENDEGGFLVVFEEERTLNLLDLRNGRVELLADAELPVGKYDQMRLVVTEGQITLNNDDATQFKLKVPSGESSGIKLNFEFEIVEGQELALLLDIDVSRAFSAIPSGRIDNISTISGFHFLPAVSMRVISVRTAGRITGIVRDNNDPANPLGGKMVTAFLGDVEVTSTVTEADGSFTLMGLPRGNYVLEFYSAGFEPLTIDPVQVLAGQTTDMGVVVMMPSG